MKTQPETRKKTRKKLMDAFWEIYKNRRIEKITVGSITKKAFLNRGTFYEYFDDVYDLLEQLENELLDDITDWLDSKFEEKGKMTFDDISHEMASLFSRYDDKIYILLSDKGDPAFQQKLKQKIRDHLSESLDVPQNSETFEYLLTFVISSVSGLISHWYDTGKKIDSEELLIMIQSLLTSGAQGYLRKEI